MNDPILNVANLRRQQQRRRAPSVPETPSTIAAFYTRVSTPDQGTRFSLPSQLEGLKRKAEAEGCTVPDEFVFVDQFTGKVASRPNFNQLNALVKSGKIGRVYAFSVDRFARNTEDALRFWREYRQHGVALDFVEVHIDDSPIGEFTFTQLASFSQLWGRKILMDSKRGMETKLARGKMTHGLAPYAYVYIDKHQEDGARLEVDTRMATDTISRVDVVRMVYRWRLDGLPPHRIRALLNEMGIKSPGKFRRDGTPVFAPGPWGRQVILQMLTNPTYAGRHMIGKHVIPCKPIIDEETWVAVQRVMQNNKQRWCGRPSKNFLLRGFAFCGKCGRRLNGRAGGAPRWSYAYECGNFCQKTQTRACTEKRVGRTALEETVWNGLWNVLTDPQTLRELSEDYLADQPPLPGNMDAKRLQKRFDFLTTKQATIRRMMEDQATPYEEGLRKLRANDEELMLIKIQLKEIGQSRRLPPLEEVTKALAAFRSVKPGTSYDERRPTLEAIQDLRIEYSNEEVSIFGKIPLPVAAKNRNEAGSVYYSSFLPFRLKLKVAA